MEFGGSYKGVKLKGDVWLPSETTLQVRLLEPVEYNGLLSEKVECPKNAGDIQTFMDIAEETLKSMYDFAVEVSERLTKSGIQEVLKLNYRRVNRLNDALRIIRRYNTKQVIEDSDYSMLKHTLKAEIRAVERENEKLITEHFPDMINERKCSKMLFIIERCLQVD